jgi:hypothetical protein
MHGFGLLTSRMTQFKTDNLRYAKLVDHYSRYIQSPVLRLKFLHNALKADPPRDLFSRLPLAGQLPERAFVMMELSKVLPPTQPAPIGLRFWSLMYRIRVLFYAGLLVLALGAASGIIYLASQLVGRFAVATQAQSSRAESREVASRTGDDAVAAIGSQAGLALDKVWLAESGDGYEFYSNGARVLTEFETAGPPRSFYRFQLDALQRGGDQFEVQSEPVGLVYHLSEGDQLPFKNQYNSSLRNASRSLLEYAREHQLYNYLIDRFGRTYRIVRDEYAADHAGNSVWVNGEAVYVSLSSSFIGICFEGRSASSRPVGPDGINEAQIYAARVLTAVLRSKYRIEDANCVTHGLVSVNPSNRLMGYHTDWVAGFPFEALGLSSKYEVELAAISRLGFGYDQAYLAAAGGKPWRGIQLASQAVKDAARRGGISEEQQRRALWQMFERAYRMDAKLRQQG